VDDLARYLRATHWTPETDPVEDPLQGARLCLLRIGDAANPFLELVEFVNARKESDLSGTAPLALHHLCFLVPTRSAGEEWARNGRFLPISDWKPAVLFGGKPVRFYYSRNRELLELLSEVA
jgi:hypothetical protein